MRTLSENENCERLKRKHKEVESFCEVQWIVDVFLFLFKIDQWPEQICGSSSQIWVFLGIFFFQFQNQIDLI